MIARDADTDIYKWAWIKIFECLGKHLCCRAFITIFQVSFIGVLLLS